MLIALALLCCDDAQVVTASGATVVAREFTLSREGGELVAVIVDASGEKQTLKAADLVEVSFGAKSGLPAPRPVAEDVEIRLTTGDVVRGRLGAKHEEGVALLNPVWGDPLVKFGQIRSIVFPLNRAYLPRRLPDKAEDADLIFTKAGDRAAGTILSVSNAGVAYKSNALNREVVQPAADTAGVWLIETEAAPAEPSTLLASVLASDGSSLRGDVQSLKDGILAFKDLYGQERKVGRASLASLHFKNGRVVYLSDLAPKAVEEEANYIRGPKKLPSDLDYPFQRDRGAKGGPIVLGGVEHRKGLGVRAHSALTYPLNGAYRRFQAVVGLDAAAAGLGAVRVEVWIDDRKAAEHRFAKADAPRPVDLDVAGAKDLRLVVTWAGHGMSDFADWGSARLIR
ncbi:MAG TPA: NPCBM/NEW2 domain-containing protein [Planctomycetota bacterium]